MLFHRRSTTVFQKVTPFIHLRFKAVLQTRFEIVYFVKVALIDVC